MMNTVVGDDGGWKQPPNTALQLTNTDAAQSAILSLCLLSVLAAECHVGRATAPSRAALEENHQPQAGQTPPSF